MNTTAKDRQGMIEAKFETLEHMVARANAIDPKKLSGDRVVFGATVTIEDITTVTSAAIRLSVNQKPTSKMVGSVVSPGSRSDWA